MKTNFDASPPRCLRSFAWWSVVVLALLSAPVGAGEPKPKPSEKIKITVLGTVAKPGTYPLDPPVTVEAAFKAAGGWSGQGEGGSPPKYCHLVLKNSQGSKDKIKVTIHIDRVTKIVEVTDKTWKTKAMPPGSVLDLPEIIF